MLLHVPVDVLDGDRRVVDQDADRERRPPSVITLIVCPSSDSAISELRTASGIDTVMMSVERQLPRKTQDHEAGQRRGDQPFANDGGNRGF